MFKCAPTHKSHKLKKDGKTLNDKTKYFVSQFRPPPQFFFFYNEHGIPNGERQKQKQKTTFIFLSQQVVCFSNKLISRHNIKE